MTGTAALVSREEYFLLSIPLSKLTKELKITTVEILHIDVYKTKNLHSAL